MKVGGSFLEDESYQSANHWSLDHNLEAEDHLLVVPALGGADVAVGEREPPGQPHRQILLAAGELCSHRGARAVGGKLSVSIWQSFNSNF